MLRITGLSLLLGALALIAGLAVFYQPTAKQDNTLPTLRWDATRAWVENGVGTIENGTMAIQVNEQGQGTVRLTSKPIDTQAYAYLHISLEEPPEKPGVVITWTTGKEDNKTHSYILESESRDSLWLSTEELKGWQGDISSLRLHFFAQPGNTVRVRDLSLYPASTTRQMLAIYSDLIAYEPWNRAAMNSHTGVTQVSSYYPTILAATALVLSLIAYGVLLIFRSKLRFSWQVVALIFLACWIFIDMTWQNRLLHQLADTHRTFSGKNTPEKLTVGPDAALYNFVTQFKPLIESDETRVFIASTDEYNGLRVAYFLYPMNVYWPEPGRPFPRNQFLKSGDYIVLVVPTAIEFDPKKSKLRIPRRAPLDATLVYTTPMGSLVRLD